MNTEQPIDLWCPHLYVVGDAQCRLCTADVRGTALTDENVPPGAVDDDGVDWGDVSPDSVASWTPDDVGSKAPVAYPEYSDNPHNHRFTLSVTGDKAPMMVVRGNSAAEITAAIQELETYGVWANVGAAHASMRAQGAIGAGLGPVTPVSPQAPPPGIPQGPPPGMPPAPAPTGPPFGPNVSVPQAPNYQGPPPQQWQQAAPASGGWGGGGGARGAGPQEKPRPAGWSMVDVPYADKDRFKALRAQGTESGNYLRGKIQWGGKGVYWLDPSVAQWIAQQGFPVQV